MKKEEAIQRMTDIMKLQRKSPNTIKTYLKWVRRFANYVQAHPSASHEEKIGGFLSQQIHKQYPDCETCEWFRGEIR